MTFAELDAAQHLRCAMQNSGRIIWAGCWQFLKDLAVAVGWTFAARLALSVALQDTSGSTSAWINQHQAFALNFIGMSIFWFRRGRYSAQQEALREKTPTAAALVLVSSPAPGGVSNQTLSNRP